MNSSSSLLAIDHHTYSDEKEVIKALVKLSGLSEKDRQHISEHGAQLVKNIRQLASPGLMEVFLAEYGLSTDEGIALMCLSEALLRVPDAETIDALIEDKIASSDWAKHMGQSTSPLVNASTWALMLTGKVLHEQSPGPVGHIREAIKRIGEPLIRKAVNQAMKEMGRQFVLGENIDSAMTRAAKMEKKGYTYSYDMLGEAARTNADAERYHLAYSNAITSIASACNGHDSRTNPGISVKLSALFPRYEVAKRERVLSELTPRIKSLALIAKSAGVGLTIDAEEADRLTLSLEVIERILSEPALSGWDGFGVVVQAYGQRASHVIEWLYQLAQQLDCHISVRLVKGAYWDSEIKKSQEKGMSGFPVFTTKPATDVSYIANAKLLLDKTDRIYPQFATHNAHTVAAISYMAKDTNSFEFQRLHGMGEQLHDMIKTEKNTRCRIYAPVGPHHDLLAYLVRRLLENGANSSFVNQIVDEDVAPEVVASDPFVHLNETPKVAIKLGTELFQPERNNSMGWDLNHLPSYKKIDNARKLFREQQWLGTPLIANKRTYLGSKLDVFNPALVADQIGTVHMTTTDDINEALSNAQIWKVESHIRAQILNKTADLYEENYAELFSLLAREAGKTLPDAISEVREAVDFLRYYATQAISDNPVGNFVCISPWNFPLAIFTGQIAAALAAGNAVLAKPAEQTSLIAWRAVQMMHEAGIPETTLQLLPGDGTIGAKLTSHPKVDGVVFTGSTATAQNIRRSMAQNLKPGAPLIAETGGLNAMIIDSTALPEQAVDAVMESAFQSAGQRCSALRCLYVQEDIADIIKEMLFGAMDELSLNDPWLLNTDSGPVIDQQALNIIKEHVDKAESENRVLKKIASPNSGTFFGPTVIQVDGIEDLEQEIFGPVLHIATFKANQIDQVIDQINTKGYGLTFGLQTRIDDQVQNVCERISAGNIYVNRNQIGAIVGSQPFGGCGLSGTGPKAGGPHYLQRFYQRPAPTIEEDNPKPFLKSKSELQELINTTLVTPNLESIRFPGPTGESNNLSSIAKDPLLCFGPSPQAALKQANVIRALGGAAVECPMNFPEKILKNINGYSGVVWWGNDDQARALGEFLSQSNGPLIPLITGVPDTGHVLSERHVCVDTTASGGNAELLSNANT